jgi:hypothetical protein
MRRLMPQLIAERSAETRLRIAPSPTPERRISATQASTRIGSRSTRRTEPMAAVMKRQRPA